MLDFGRLADGGLYAIHERLDGVSLSSASAQGPGFSQERMLHVVRQIVEGLSGAHDAGVYHGDLSIDQVLLVTHEGRRDFVKLRGFNHAASALESVVNSADAAPTADARSSWAKLKPAADAVLAKWNSYKATVPK